MLDETADRKFTMEPRFKDEPQTSTELASWYENNFLRAIDRVRAMSAEELLTPVDFYGVFNLPVVYYLGVREQSQHPSSRTARHLSSSHGIKVPVHLRRQLR